MATIGVPVYKATLWALYNATAIREILLSRLFHDHLHVLNAIREVCMVVTSYCCCTYLEILRFARTLELLTKYTGRRKEFIDKTLPILDTIQSIVLLCLGLFPQSA
jgi:hypothetical protein